MILLAVWLLLYATSASCLIRECVESMNGENYFKYTGDSYKTINLPNDLHCKDISKYKQFYFIESNHYNITDKTYSEEGCETEVVKVDCASESIEKDVYFPKCCPPNYAYEPGEHKCVQSNTTISEKVDSVVLIKSGLENCKVIIDFIFQNLGELSIDQDRAITFDDKIYRYENYCIDDILDSEDYVLRICDTIDFCKTSAVTGIRCIKKCCPDGQIYKGLECGPEAGHGIQVRQFNDSIKDIGDKFAVVAGEECRKYPVDRNEYQFSIEKNDSIIINEMGMFKEYLVDEPYYCIEHVEYGEFIMDTFMLCYIQNEQPTVRYKFTRIVLLMSSVCLLLTIMGYLLLQELRNLIGKLIICYCASLLLAFLTLTWVQFFPYAENYCTAAGYTITFSVIAAFSWMNIISYDIWCVLGSMKMQHGNQKHKERRKFLLYNIYGWSLPTIITSFAAIDNQYYILPPSLHAHVGQLQCMIDKYIEGNYGHHFFIALPCGILILLNLIIYIKTVCYVLKVKNEINRMKDLEENQTQKKIVKRDMERIFMVLRIFVIMGISWLFEIISSFLDFKQDSTLSIIEIIFDIFNCLQGVFIFCIFMLKDKVIYAVAKKLGIKRQNRDRSPITTSTAETMLKSSSSPDMMLRKFH